MLIVLNSVFAILTMVFAVFMAMYKDEVAAPIELGITPALAFQFAKTPEDIERLFYDLDGRILDLFVAKMYWLTWIDFLFITSYTGFIFSFIRLMKSGRHLLLLQSLLGLALLIGLMDVLENIQLLNVLKCLGECSGDNLQHILDKQKVFTWLKWESTAVLLFLMIPFLWDRDFWLKVMSMLNVLVLIFGISAILTNWNRQCLTAISYFISLIFIALGLFLIYALTRFIFSFKDHKVL